MVFLKRWCCKLSLPAHGIHVPAKDSANVSTESFEKARLIGDNGRGIGSSATLFSSSILLRYDFSPITLGNDNAADLVWCTMDKMNLIKIFPTLLSSIRFWEFDLKIENKKLNVDWEFPKLDRARNATWRWAWGRLRFRVVFLNNRFKLATTRRFETLRKKYI